MHRFGRSAQQKMKDRWGGSFILATVLALGSAYVLGSYASKLMQPKDTVGPVMDSPGISLGTGGQGNAAVNADEFNLYFVQVGSFRSESMAQKAARDYGMKGYAGMVAPRNEQGYYQVYAGVFTDKDVATDVEAGLKAEGIKDVWTRPQLVHYNPSAIPTAAMGNFSADVANGLDMLNVYLYEAARWIESRATDSAADTTRIVSLGSQLGDLARRMGPQTDAKMAMLVMMADAASTHADDVKAASTALTSSDEYMMAVTDYIALLNQYQTFYEQK